MAVDWKTELEASLTTIEEAEGGTRFGAAMAEFRRLYALADVDGLDRLRDYFAGLALVGQLSRSHFPTNCYEHARSAYEMADAMLTRRAIPRPTTTGESRPMIEGLRSLLRRCLPIIEADAQMAADLSRFAPLSPEDQSRHDSTETESERLLVAIPEALKATA
jgi:hypothetical protein